MSTETVILTGSACGILGWTVGEIVGTSHTSKLLISLLAIILSDLIALKFLL